LIIDYIYNPAEFITLLFLHVLAINVVHEIGHISYAAFIKKQYEITYKKGVGFGVIVENAKSLNDLQRILLRVWGILAGFFYLVIFPDIILLGIYLIGCQNDFIDIYKIVRG